MKVLFITNIPSPYNVDYLNELGKLCEVTAVFERRTSKGRDKSWGDYKATHFKCIVLNGLKYKNDMSISVSVVRYIKAFRDDRIIIANPASPTGIISIVYCKLNRIPFILQSEGGFAGNSNGIKEKIKKRLMSGAVMYLSGMKSDKEYFLSYGGTRDTIVNYPFTSYYDKDIRKSSPSIEEKRNAADELGLLGDFRVLYVGSINYNKGVDILLQAFSGFEDNIHLYLVGGKITSELQNIIEEMHLSNFHFVEFANKEIVQKYYLGSDIFVLPTRGDTWGLVINEAMSFGLPVITTKSCVAGYELIEDYENGFLIDSEDIEDLHKKIEFLIENRNIVNRMGDNNIRKIQPYNLENMAFVIYSALRGNNDGKNL